MDITIDHIKKVVSDFYGFDGDEIDKKCRKRKESSERSTTWKNPICCMWEPISQEKIFLF